MSTPEPAPASAAVRQIGMADRWISRAAAGTVAALAGIAGALSYSHMRQLAQVHGQAGWHAHAFPLSVDGIEIVASLVLLADRRAGRRSGWLPWTALAAGTLGSLAANIATAHPDPIGRVIAGWPAVALLLALKLLSGLLDHRVACACTSEDPAEAGGKSTKAAHRAADRATALDPAAGGRHDTARSVAPAGLAPAVAALLPAARAARDELRQVGHRLTRDALATRLRQQGHQIRNEGITSLLSYLRHE
jgi:Protein of unknown function (DUF2637)